jgi:plastocyanin domain-containing protein
MRSSENILSIEENKGNIEKVNQLKDVLIKQQRVTVNILGLIAKERNQRFMEAAKEGAYETDNEKYEVNITPDSLKEQE